MTEGSHRRSGLCPASSIFRHCFASPECLPKLAREGELLEANTHEDVAGAINMKEKEESRPKMVGWYDPFQLARTGYEVIVSAMFGKHADKRVIQAIADTGSLKPRLYHEVTEQE